MPNQNEIQISGLSYTNKDFNTIYAELLDLVTTLTDKWDPTTSNEADPGVVLIKLGALLADKNNYNIDKNILELFPLSVSQTGNARKIYDIAGYSMKWYRSATVDVTFNYTGSLNLNNSAIDIPAYTTMVTNDDGDVVYTVLEPVALTTSIRSATVQAMQGVIKDYEVNGVTTITLDNLDEYNRLYFTETQIAENGIFIMNADADSTSSQFINQWERVDNLQLQELNQNLYRFGVLPNTDTCYIEFPQDISNLIGSGLLIKYIVSSGEQGNISANTLTSLYSNDITVTIDNNTTNVTEDIVISNASSTSNGEDPESLNAAYDNFKRIVGTFNTLVTCKDYETAVRELRENEQPLASNSVVSDRTNDINYSTYVVTLDPSTGAPTRTLNSACYSSSDAEPSEGMTAFELGLYALEPMGSVNADYYYNKSFSCNTDTAAIRDGLSEYKSIQHDWLTYNNLAHKFIYKNFYKLTGTVSTYYKVSSTEAEQIENNIRTAIIDRYNASELNFGEAIPFDDIVQTIQSADTRIKYVMLNEPEYTFRYMLSNDYTGSFSSSFSLSKSDYLSILAKMILSGNVQLYKFDREFNYDYGQTEVKTYGAAGLNSTEGISNITTEASIVLNEGSEYQVKQNEVIELNAPSLITTTTYGTAVTYKFVKTDNQEISSGNYYELGSGDSLAISYTDTNNTSISLTYGAGTIIQPSGFALTSTSTETTLSSTQSINICEINQTNFDDTFECIWFLNRATTVQTQAASTDGNEIQYYILFPAVSSTDTENSAVTQEYTLQENEYFMYTNRDRNALVILTSGTKLIRTVAAGSTGRVVQCQNYLNAGDVVSDGLSAIPSTDWYVWSYADGNLSAQEQMIITLGEGASIKLSNSGSSITLNNNEQALNGVTVEYKSADESSYTNLTQYNGANIGWSIRSRLNLNMSLTQPQVLTETQKISYEYTDAENQTSTTNITDCSVLSSVPLYLAGGDNIDTSSLMMDGTYSNLLRFYTYTEAVGVQTGGSTVEAVEKSGNYYLLNSANEYTVRFSLLPKTSCIIPIIKVGEGLTATISTSSTKLSLIEGFSITSTQGSSIALSAAGVYYLYADNSNSGNSADVVLSISFGSGEAGRITNSLQLGDINILPGTFNGDNIFSDTITKTLSYIASTTGEAVPDYENLLTYLKSYSGSNEFYYTYEIDSIDEIDTSILPTNEVGNVLAPEVVWDVNNICNKFTIAQINLSDMSVKVSNSSRA